MRTTTKAMAVTTALVLGATAAFAGDDGSPREGRHRPRAGRLARVRQRIAERRRARHELVRSLAFTDDQRRAALERARAARPIVEEARREAARLHVAQESAASRTPESRAAARDARRELRRRTAEKLAPLARDVVAALTPEQRARLEGFAAARGRKLDDGRLVRLVGRWLARPMTADLLEARLGAGR